MKTKTLIVAITFPLAIALAHAAAPAETDLTGQVILPAGQSGEATVLLRYAQLKTNFEYSVFTRNPILPKRSQTDRNGHFKINSLDARWLYSGNVLAPGCKSQELAQIDPAAGPLKISLEPANTNVSPDRVVHGRVMDTDDHPIVGALIHITGTTRNGQGTWPGQDVDSVSVSDDAGNFVVYGKAPFAAIDGKVEATGYAEASFEQWPSDAVNQEWARTGSVPAGLFGFAKPLHQITLVKGGSLQGRLLQDGRPVANAEIRLNQCAVGSDCWFWNGATVTDAEGRFTFAHLPPGQSYAVCGNWDLLATGGTFPQTDVKIGDNGSTNDMGDVSLKPVTEVAGHIQLSDGKPIAAKSRYSLSDAAMGASSPSVFGADGAFHFAALPGDKVYIYLRVPGYQFTPRDFMLISGTMTNITVVPNMTNLVFKLTPATKAMSRLFQLGK